LEVLLITVTESKFVQQIFSVDWLFAQLKFCSWISAINRDESSKSIL